MKLFRVGAAALALTASLSLMPVAPVSAQGGQTGQGGQGGQGGQSCTQGRAGGTQQTGPGGGTQQGGQRQAGAAGLAGLIDVVVQNVQVLNNVSALNESLNNAASQNNIQVVCLNDTLNGNQVNVLSDILNNSNVLSNNRDVLSNILNNSANNNLQNFLNQNNVVIGDVVPVAVSVLSGGAQTGDVTLYLFNPR